MNVIADARAEREDGFVVRGFILVLAVATHAACAVVDCDDLVGATVEWGGLRMSANAGQPKETVTGMLDVHAWRNVGGHHTDEGCEYDDAQIRGTLTVMPSAGPALAIMDDLPGEYRATLHYANRFSLELRELMPNAGETHTTELRLPEFFTVTVTSAADGVTVSWSPFGDLGYPEGSCAGSDIRIISPAGGAVFDQCAGDAGSRTFPTTMFPVAGTYPISVRRGWTYDQTTSIPSSTLTIDTSYIKN